MAGGDPTGQTHYELLQLPPSATVEELRRAFRRLSKLYHPDTTSLPAAEAQEHFRLLQEAYGTLSDPLRRQAYDVRLRPTAPPRPVVMTVLRRGEPRLQPVRRALSSGEWFALLLLGLALAASLVLGVGMAWVRGTDLVRQPSWWSEAAAPAPRLEVPTLAQLLPGAAAVQSGSQPGVSFGNADTPYTSDAAVQPPAAGA
ncbi:J domain-containing protein [Cyanobium sp. Morenito 9A2]|uniref:J domain-containing protein n=1 Tax=Cyanobium sp. Morenito 9A2 TaxID=2823718 RepID=UPI0020CEF6E1|nr:J domain-containing protein [Cyanobium sp. Morenito 9A2]MCP9849165.1 J domain-containing protein [Cyanobium sp. Morenito 9A2]